MVAFEITAPVGSVTVPEMAPLPANWATAARGARIRAIRSAIELQMANREVAADFPDAHCLLKAADCLMSLHLRKGFARSLARGPRAQFAHNSDASGLTSFCSA